MWGRAGLGCQTIVRQLIIVIQVDLLNSENYILYSSSIQLHSNAIFFRMIPLSLNLISKK